MTSESFAETRSQPPSTPSLPSSPSSPSPRSPSSIPLPPSPPTSSTPSIGSPRVFTASISSPTSSQPTSTPSFHHSSAESSLFDLSIFFSLDISSEARESSSGLPSPSPDAPISEANPQSCSQSTSQLNSPSIPQSMFSSQVSENFAAPGGTWTITTEEHPPRVRDTPPQSSQTSSEESFISFTGTLPLSPAIPLSRCRDGWRISPSSSDSSDTSPESSIYMTAPVPTSPAVEQDGVHDQHDDGSSSSDNSSLQSSMYFTAIRMPIVAPNNSQDNPYAVDPDTFLDTSPEASPDTSHTVPALRVRIPGSWESQINSPIPSPTSPSSPQQSFRAHAQTSFNPYPSPIIQVIIMPGSWVSLPSSPVASVPGSPVVEGHREPVPIDGSTSTASTASIIPATSSSSSTPTGDGTDNTPEITVTVAELNIYHSTSTNTDASIATDGRTDTSTEPSAGADQNPTITLSINLENEDGGSSNRNTEGTSSTLEVKPSLTRSSSHSSPSSTGSTLPGCVQQ